MLVAALFASDRASAADPLLRHETDTHVVVRDDGTYRAEHTVRTQILADAALAAAASTSVSYLEGFETLTVTAAAVVKPSGERTAVDLSTVNARAADHGHSKDTRTRTIAFPALAVGDTVVYTTIRDTRETSFPRHFSYAWTFARSQPWSKARHLIDAPASMQLQVALSEPSTGMTYTRSEAPGGRSLHEITYTATDGPAADEPGAVAAADRDPGFAITTFADHAAFARAYWAEAAPRIALNAQLRQLAAEVTRNQPTERDKVVAVDRWMKRNIRYAASYLGRERWVPKAAAAVLAARAGDCKDYAVLMSAMLSAIGIVSEHVLLNLGTSYRLARLPPVSFNHVMVHVPSVALLIDPSATLAATGVLSLHAYDKPALFVSATGARVGQTPAMAAADHVTEAHTTATLAADGTLAGVTTQTATGIFAASARAAVIRFTLEGSAKSAARRLAALGTPGAGFFDARSPSELAEPYAVKASFSLTDKIDLPLSGHRHMPVGLPLHARPGTFLFGQRVARRKQDFVCFAGRQTERLDLTIADRLPLPRIPPPKKIANASFTYEATYALDGRTFRAVRVFTSNVASQVCPAALENDIDGALDDVLASVGTVLPFSVVTGSRRRP